MANDQFLRDVNDVPHPTLPASAFASAAVRSRLMGLRRTQREEANLGLFSVIREARGHTADHPDDRNLLVRDLIWIQRLPAKEEECGYYFSTIDDSVCGLQGQNTIDATRLTFHGLKRPEGPHSIRVACRIRRHEFPLQYREALIVGETRQEHRPAAWKGLMIRPEWSDEKLEIALATIEHAEAIYSYLADKKYIGPVLSIRIYTGRISS